VCVAVYFSVCVDSLSKGAAGVLQCVLQYISMCIHSLSKGAAGVLQCVAVYFSVCCRIFQCVLQCVVAVCCCSMLLQYVVAV